MKFNWKQNKNAAAAPRGSVEVILRDELMHCRRWACSFECKPKDHRYYEIVEDTILQGFDYRYLSLKMQMGAFAPSSRFLFLTKISLSAPVPG